VVRILIATAGALSPNRVADLVERWLGSAQRVTVMTVIEVPHPFLDTLETPIWRPLDHNPPGDDQPDVALQYVEERGRKRTEALVAALEVRGVPVDTIFREGEDPASEIVMVADQIEADLIVMGATRPIFADWGSVSIRVMQESRRPLLLIPGAARSSDPDEVEGAVSETAG